VYEYGHSAGWCSVTGGYVYRGPVTAWHGLYIAADWCGGRFVLNTKGNVRLRSTTEHHITSFGEGPGGRLFAVGDGKLFQVVPSGERP
jgi:hypothetical protein